MATKAVIYGDSISCGKYTAPGDDCPKSYVGKIWFQTVAEKFGWDIVNYSVSGISVSSTSSVMSDEAVSLKYGRMDADADIVIIAAGTNDFGTNVVIGNEDDDADISFCGALNLLCGGIAKKYPSAKLCYVLPIGRKDEKSNENGNSLGDYCEKIKKIAVKYGFCVIDSSVHGFESHDPSLQNEIMLDGVHIDQRGHDLYGEAVIKAIN